MQGTDFDVIVIGGGPCGSAAASLLAQHRRRVLVVERNHLPQHHVGESTLLSIHSSLRWIGVDEKVAAAGFRRKTGGTYIWGMDRVPWSFHFYEVTDGASERPYSYEVERDTFDQILLEHARDSGATVVEGCLVRDLLLDGGSMRGIVLDRGGGPEALEARVVIDASGQACLAGRRFGWRQMNPRLRNAAIYGYWSGGPPEYERLGGDLTAEDRSNILICSTSFGWIWVIPLRGDRVSIGVVLAGGADRPASLSGGRAYHALVESCAELTPCLRSLRLISDESIRSISDWSYCCTQFTLPGLFLSGDAACFVDPILSSGLHLALRGGISAACAANSVLMGYDSNLVGRWYEATYRAAYREYEQMALWWYHGDRNRDSWFKLSRNLIDPARYGQDLEPRRAFVQLVSGIQHSQHVEEVVDGWPHPLSMVSLFHAHAGFTSSLDRLRRKFGVKQNALTSPFREVRPLESQVSLDTRVEDRPNAPRIRPDVVLAAIPDRNRLRVAIKAFLSSTGSEVAALDVTDVAPVLLRLDGTRDLKQIGLGIGLDHIDYQTLHHMALELQRHGLLENVPGD